jgi:hypothetical protein
MQLEDRGKVFETKFARDAELGFKEEAQATRLMAVWAAETMGYTKNAIEVYADRAITELVRGSGLDKVAERIRADFKAKNMPTDALESTLNGFLTEARAQFRPAV